MKMTKLVVLVMTIAVALFILIPNLSWAADERSDDLQGEMCSLPRSRTQPASPRPRCSSLVSDEAKQSFG